MDICFYRGGKTDIKAVVSLSFRQEGDFEIKLSLRPELVLNVRMGPNPDRHVWIDAFAHVCAKCSELGASSLLADLSAVPESLLPDAVYGLGFGFSLSCYRFTLYKPAKDALLQEVYLTVSDEEICRDALYEALLLGQYTCRARDMINARSNEMTPQILAQKAEELAEESGFEVERIPMETVREKGMGGFLEVSKGSGIPAEFFVARYFGDPEHKNKVLGIAGKGLCYDTGGLSIKANEKMLDMYMDMAGAAAALCALAAAARNKLKVNVIVAVAACENIPSQYSSRPGDIIRMMNGTTVYFNHVDAEGRVVLGDTLLWLAREEHVSSLLDVATLTTASLAAVGPLVAPYMSANGFRTGIFETASAASGQISWPLPLLNEYEAYIRCEHADIQTIGDNSEYPTVIGGLFLRHFTDGLPWAHLDICGAAINMKSTPLNPSGATGYGVALLYQMLKQLQKQD